MPKCQRCQQAYADHLGGCPRCDNSCQTPAGMPEQCELFATVELCKVSDEITGMAIKTFLLDKGVESILRDMHGSFYGGVLTNLQGYWGSIIVDLADAEKAKKMYAAFQKEFYGR